MHSSTGWHEHYWGLAQSPFQNDADPNFFFRSRSHLAALLKLRYVIDSRQGAALLTGDIGIGKTCLVHCLAHDLPDDCRPVIHLVFPQLTPPEFLAFLAAELGADAELLNHAPPLDRVLRQLIDQLSLHTKEGRRPVIVVDEAHLIENQRLFQTMQLLLNFRQRPRIEFTLLLVGELPLLSQMHRAAALDSRLAVKSLLSPLTREETSRYVQHRLQTAGAKRFIFDQSALEALHDQSGGVPRKINSLCELALLIGSADRLATVSAREIEAVAGELASIVPD
jgi:general secretion pathway protein A